MSKNQLHGKTYEDHLKSVFPGSSDHERSNSSSWDIEKDYDKIAQLPTSIKTSKSKVVELADARKVWLLNEPYRLLVGKYNQVGDVKEFHTLCEFLVSLEEHQKLLGDITYNEVEEYHKSLLTFKLGFHEDARKWAKYKKQILKPRSIIQLNPKIDSKTQRRLQASIKLDELMSNIKQYTVLNKDEFYRGISAALRIQSSAREFNE